MRSTTTGQTCPACHGAMVNDSDAFFRSFDVSYRCNCGGMVSTNGKGIDRLLGLMVLHSECRATSYVPPTVWCQACGQNLVGNWKSLIVRDHADDAATKVSRALSAFEGRRLQPFRAPQGAQRLEPPLIDCRCDTCGNYEWWTPDGHAPSVGDFSEDQMPLRCFACGRWAIFNMEK